MPVNDSLILIYVLNTLNSFDTPVSSFASVCCPLRFHGNQLNVVFPDLYLLPALL